MTKDKQIAEMARIAYGIEVFDESDAKIAVEDGLLDPLLNLYNAGYRKASEIAEELIFKIYALSKGINDRIVENGRFDSYDAGSSTVLGLILAVVNDFREKYTEGEKDE